MSDSISREEIVIKDIHMPFASMIVFMVKWAIASIPALIILVVLTAVFWGAAIGLVSSWRSSARHPQTTNTSKTDTDSTRHQGTAEESAYLNKVIVRNISLGKSALGEQSVWGEVKNTGDRTLKEVKITVFCLGADGNAVFEKTYYPVLVSKFGLGDNTPLKPGYSRQFGLKLDDAPSDWAKKVEVKVSKIAFQ